MGGGDLSMPVVVKKTNENSNLISKIFTVTLQFVYMSTNIRHILNICHLSTVIQCECSKNGCSANLTGHLYFMLRLWRYRTVPPHLLYVLAEWCLIISMGTTWDYICCYCGASKCLTVCMLYETFHRF